MEKRHLAAVEDPPASRVARVLERIRAFHSRVRESRRQLSEALQDVLDYDPISAVESSLQAREPKSADQNQPAKPEV